MTVVPEGPFGLEQRCQVVEAVDGIGMLRTQLLFSDGQGLLDSGGLAASQLPTDAVSPTGVTSMTPDSLRNAPHGNATSRE